MFYLETSEHLFKVYLYIATSSFRQHFYKIYALGIYLLQTNSSNARKKCKNLFRRSLYFSNYELSTFIVDFENVNTVYSFELQHIKATHLESNLELESPLTCCRFSFSIGLLQQEQLVIQNVLRRVLGQVPREKLPHA